MSNETFLIPIRQNNDLSDVALNELRMDLDEHPLNQRKYTELAYLPGNSRKYSLNSVKTIESPLRHKKILFLGSSVTFGFGALGESFVDYLWKKDGIDAIKDAENGTTLVDQDTSYHGDSYVARFKEELKEDKPDMLVLQLSTNDANTNPYFESNLYEQMVDSTLELAKKWGVQVLDLYHNSEFKKQDSLYMADEIHPTRAGYLEKWMPLFEEQLNNLLLKK